MNGIENVLKIFATWDSFLPIIQDFANDIWNNVPIEVPKPSLTKEEHFVSSSNLQLLNKEEDEVK